MLNKNPRKKTMQKSTSKNLTIFSFTRIRIPIQKNLENEKNLGIYNYYFSGLFWRHDVQWNYFSTKALLNLESMHIFMRPLINHFFYILRYKAAFLETSVSRNKLWTNKWPFQTRHKRLCPLPHAVPHRPIPSEALQLAAVDLYCIRVTTALSHVPPIQWHL